MACEQHLFFGTKCFLRTVTQVRGLVYPSSYSPRVSDRSKMSWLKLKKALQDFVGTIEFLYFDVLEIYLNQDDHT